MKSTRATVVLQAPSVESLEVQIYATSTPVGTAPGFALTAEGTQVTSGTSYTAGEWAEAYGATETGWTKARTPTIGGSGSLTVTSGLRYWLWSKSVAGSETAVELCGTVVVP